MLVSNPERFVIIPNIDEGAKFVIAHEAKENISPKETSAITSNGTYIITPSKGFNAMREVEVDVRIEEKADPILQSKAILIKTNNSNVNIVADEGFDGLSNISVDVQIPTEEKSVDITRNGEVEILPTSADAMTKVTANVQVPPPPLEEKQIIITRNGVTEIVPTNKYGLSKVEVVAEVAPNLQDKQVDITENGTQTITADEGYEGLNSVEVNSEVYEGFDLVSAGLPQEYQDAFNAHYKNGIEYAEYIKQTLDGASGSVYGAFQGDKSVVFVPELDLRNVTDGAILFKRCTNLEYVENIIFDKYSFGPSEVFHGCTSLKKIRITFLNGNFTWHSQIFAGCTNIKELHLENISNLINEILWWEPTAYPPLLEIFNVSKWKKNNIRIYHSTLIPSCIHYNIQNAISLADGATARTLTLNATAYDNWVNSEYYLEDQAVMPEKGITVTK